MPVDMDDLLREAGGEPETQIDADQLWTRGRRKRRVRLAGSSVAGATALVMVAVAAVGLTGGSNIPVIAPVGQDDGAPVDRATEDSASVDTADEPTGVGDADATVGSLIDPEALSNELLDIQQRIWAEQQNVQELVERAERERQAAEDAAVEAAETAEEVTAAEDPGGSERSEPAEAAPEVREEPSPEPDAARFGDPCRIHEGGEMRAFIDVVSPVGGQQVGGSLDLVGCSSVYEGTIMFRVLDRNGAVMVSGLTTATAGGPEIGEFRETIGLPGSGAHTVEVFWEDAADQSERDLVTITLAS